MIFYECEIAHLSCNKHIPADFPYLWNNSLHALLFLVLFFKQFVN